MRKHDREDSGRWLVFRIMMLSALAIVAGQIATVSSREGDTAFQSANDRSRWSTVAALVEDGTYQIDRLHKIQDPIHRHHYPWRSIDRVMHVDHDGELHHYSSKPPLLPTMVAGVYFVVRATTGLSMTDQPLYVPRIVLMLVNIPLLLMFFLCTIAVIDRVCRSSWGRYLAAACVCFSTMMLPFATSLNNHLPAASATAMTMWLYFFMADQLSDSSLGSRRIHWIWWFLAGVMSAFAAANELPALSMLCLWVLLFAVLAPRSMVPMLAGVLLVAVAFFGTTWIGHESLRPPYAHRGNGELVFEISFDEVNRDLNPSEDAKAFDPVAVFLVGEYGLDPNFGCSFEPSVEPGRWRLLTPVGDFGLLKEADRWQVREWDDWYEYPGSYWQGGDRIGIDLGEPSRVAYLFHMLLGHHGIFSLTPVLLLFPVGMVILFWFGADDMRRFTTAVVLSTVVCIVFYLMRPEIDRNYGGVSICFRWLLWFTPLWLLMVAVTIDHGVHLRWFRRLLLCLLAISIFSVATSLDSAWQHPWLYRYWQFLGWLGG